MRRSHRWYGAGSAPAVVGCRRRCRSTAHHRPRQQTFTRMLYIMSLF
jgi:hypothetical protein